MSDLYERVRFAREAAEVERCHTHPHLLRYSVGHHSGGVAMLVIQVWKARHDCLPPARLIAAALAHDLPELVTGDIPSPTKNALASTYLEDQEEKILGWLALPDCHALTQEEATCLAAADAVELFLWCLEEVHQRGNKAFQPWVNYYVNKWSCNRLPAEFEEIVHFALGAEGGRGDQRELFQGAIGS